MKKFQQTNFVLKNGAVKSIFLHDVENLKISTISSIFSTTFVQKKTQTFTPHDKEIEFLVMNVNVENI